MKSFPSVGQTSADSARGISRTSSGGKRYSYENLVNFVGPNPLWKILNPFHQVDYRSYDSIKKDDGSSKDL